MNLASVRTRLAFSVSANVLRAAISFLTGLLIARGLGPGSYGDLSFLIGSFVAIRSLLDLGSAGAFYTFISQRQRRLEYYFYYWGWLAAQFLFSLILVIVILPQDTVQRLWLGHSKGMIVAALAASFMQQQVWMTIVQIGEAARQTVKIQVLGLALAAFHFLQILALYFLDVLSVTSALLATVFVYLLAAAVAVRLLRTGAERATAATDFSAREMFREYLVFCRPLMLMSFASFVYEFADRWLLQRYGGSEQQGFYQAAMQFSSVSLLVAMSVLNIFWKEISEAYDRQDRDRVARLYWKANRSLVLLSTILASMLLPWAEQIVRVLFGDAYAPAWTSFAILMLYPIHQSMGQINSTMFFACRQTRSYTAIGIAVMAASIPVTWFVIAPTSSPLLAGLELGALGLALKMVGMNVASVNVQAWLLARLNGWKYDWQFQVFGVLLIISLAYVSKVGACLLLGEPSSTSQWREVLPVFLLSTAVYFALVVSLIATRPAIAGLTRAEIDGGFRQFQGAFRSR